MMARNSEPRLQLLSSNLVADHAELLPGSGCSGTQQQTFETTLSNGAISNVAVRGSGSAYITDAAIIICDPPCTGSGAAASCTAVNGNVTAVTITNGGMGYSGPSRSLLACSACCCARCFLFDPPPRALESARLCRVMFAVHSVC